MIRAFSGLRKGLGAQMRTLIFVGFFWLFWQLGMSPVARGSVYDAPVAAGGNPNIYNLNPNEFARSIRSGLRHALSYPELTHSGTMPYNAVNRLIRRTRFIPGAGFILERLGIARFGTTWDELFTNMGLIPYPEEEGAGPFFVPLGPDGRPYATHMGFSVAENPAGVRVMSFSCASCHARNLFGRPVIGLNSLTSRATEFALFSRQITEVPDLMFRTAAGASSKEMQVFRATKTKLAFVDGTVPLAPGLDSALATVGRSLDLRGEDAYARMSGDTLRNPRTSWFSHHHLDSKPAVWWLRKYKNRSLSDGSVAGNPVITNLLWNEIGRGADLQGFEAWIDTNEDVIRDLTVAVYAAQAPRYTDFFSAADVDLTAAKRGQRHFLAHCARCHGVYEKAWDEAGRADRSPTDLLATTLVRYQAETRAMNVGTDPMRADGMVHLAPRLNSLAITQKYGLHVTPQAGSYVPPPLVGIWARWPYFHNNAAASLCEVLTRADQRRKKYFVVPAEDQALDYDRRCVGMPEPEKVRPKWRRSEYLFDTQKEGLSAAGHDEGIFLRDGEELLSPTDKLDLIEFLKTL